MDQSKETKDQRLARLEKELAQLKDKLPEHCHGTEGFISDHRASPEHVHRIEELEEEVGKLRAELGR